MPQTSPVRRSLAAALSLVFPVWCAGCDTLGVLLCDTCRSQLEATPASQAVRGDLVVRSALPYEGVAARAIRAFKEEGRTALARPLGRTLAALLPPASVVPVPSSRAAMRRRGYRVTDLLVRHAGRRPARLLHPARAAADQRALGRDDRARNAAGLFRAEPCEGVAVVIVDDVVTTGATLVDAARALREAGAEVLGAVTVAATPRRAIVTAGPRDIRTVPG